MKNEKKKKNWKIQDLNSKYILLSDNNRWKCQKKKKEKKK